jgi:hypothetical protein
MNIEWKNGICDCCGSENVPVIFFKDENDCKYLFCSLCSGTILSNYFRHPKIVSQETLLSWQLMASMLNQVLYEIRELRRVVDEINHSKC